MWYAWEKKSIQGFGGIVCRRDTTRKTEAQMGLGKSLWRLAECVRVLNGFTWLRIGAGSGLS
jgi:hypothetical protein